ncbi:MAG: hypothetical protein QMD50_00430 [Patescibacteria group bacterium]|nr:hypothetical protein [Patescibacteria group bacterium]
MTLKIIKKLVYLLLLFLIGFSIVIPQARGAFGISPPFLNADHLVKGTKYIQKIYLVQDQPNEDLRIKAVLDISEKIRPWIGIDKGFEFIIPKGTRQFPVEVTINVPSNADLGIYHGNLSFTGAPSKTGQVTIALGVQVALNLTVGEGIFRKFSVPFIRMLDIEEGWNPRVFLRVNNEGNITESFTSATYELMDQFGETRLAYLQKASDLPEVPAFAQKEYTVEFPINFKMGIGQYWGNTVFYQDNKIIASQKTVFNVLESGSISGPTAQISNFVKQNQNYLIVISAVIIFIIGIGFWKKNRKLRKSGLS